MFLTATGRDIEEQLNGERARPCQCWRRLRGTNGRYGRCLRDRGLRICLEEPKSRHRGAGKWCKIAYGGWYDYHYTRNSYSGLGHSVRSRRDLSWYSARIYQLMFAYWWSSSLMVSVQNHSGLIVRLQFPRRSIFGILMIRWMMRIHWRISSVSVSG